MNGKILECGICFESLDSKQIDICTELDCSHLYHDKCLSQWCKTCIKDNNAPNCPLCRKDISKDNLDELGIDFTKKSKSEILANSVRLFQHIMTNNMYLDRPSLVRFIERYPEEMDNIIMMLEGIMLLDLISFTTENLIIP